MDHFNPRYLSEQTVKIGPRPSDHKRFSSSQTSSIFPHGPSRLLSRIYIKYIKYRSSGGWDVVAFRLPSGCAPTQSFPSREPKTGPGTGRGTRGWKRARVQRGCVWGGRVSGFAGVRGRAEGQRSISSTRRDETGWQRVEGGGARRGAQRRARSVEGP